MTNKILLPSEELKGYFFYCNLACETKVTLATEKPATHAGLRNVRVML